jgi:hypothetical protein
LTVDSDRNYAVDVKEFMRVIDRRAKIPQYLKESENTSLLHEYIGGFMDDQGKIDYRSLVDELRYFNYDDATNKKIDTNDHLESTKVSFAKTPTETHKRKTIFEDDYIVLDSQKVPTNVLDNIESRLQRVTRYLKRHFGSERALDQALKDNLAEQDKNGNLSVDDLKTFILTTCKDQIIHRHLNKKDVEAFLSAFNYNAYGAT